MRILAIRGRNLASLAGDFEMRLDAPPLADAGLFAITGPTGSGKSTTLDALCLALFDRMPRLPGGRGVEVGRADDVPESRLRSNDVRSILRRGAGEGYAEVDFRGVDGGRYRARWSVRRARPGPVGCASRRAAGAPGQGRPMATAGGAGGKPAARSRRSWSGNRRCGSCGSTCAS